MKGASIEIAIRCTSYVLDLMPKVQSFMVITCSMCPEFFEGTHGVLQQFLLPLPKSGSSQFCV
jgi:hypothetical protein